MLRLGSAQRTAHKLCALRLQCTEDLRRISFLRLLGSQANFRPVASGNVLSCAADAAVTTRP